MIVPVKSVVAKEPSNDAAVTIPVAITPVELIVTPLPTIAEVAVTIPVRFIPPVPVIYFELKSKLPPNCGVVSPIILVVIPVNEP